MAATDSPNRRYLLLRAFRGELGVTYLCSDLDTQTPVALKTVEPGLTLGASATGLIDAARNWIRIGSHPHVVTARHIQQENPLAIVIDYVAPAQGAPSPMLRSWMKVPIVPEAACAIALGITRGMVFATSQVPGLVHGDLRPENVLIGRDLRSRVTNFGLGLYSTPNPSMGRYWAPERWSGDVHCRGDIYAFGLIMLEMLAGGLTIPWEDLDTIEQAHRDGAPKRHAGKCECPDILRTLILSCLDPDESERPSTWQGVAEQLTEIWPRLSRQQPPSIPDEGTTLREDALMRGWSSLAIAHALRERGAIDAALVAYRGVARTAAREHDPALEASAVSHVALMLRVQGECDAATREAWHALELRRELKDGLGQADVMCLLADLYGSRGDRDNALGMLFAAARVFAEEGDLRGVAASRSQMAPLLRAVGREREAQDAELESASILADMKEPSK